MQSLTRLLIYLFLSFLLFTDISYAFDDDDDDDDDDDWWDDDDDDDDDDGNDDNDNFQGSGIYIKQTITNETSPSEFVCLLILFFALVAVFPNLILFPNYDKSI